MPRAGRDVRGPTCTRGSPEATDGAAPGRPAMRRDGGRACVVPELVRHGGALPPARREATRRARGAPRSGWSCAPRDGAWPRARARRGVRAGATRAVAVVPSRHAACPRGQARAGNAACGPGGHMAGYGRLSYDGEVNGGYGQEIASPGEQANNSRRPGRDRGGPGRRRTVTSRRPKRRPSREARRNSRRT